MRPALLLSLLTLLLTACETSPAANATDLAQQLKYVRAENYLLKQHLNAMGEDTTKILYGGNAPYQQETTN